MHDCTIEDSVIGVRSIIREGSVLKKVVMMGNDFYESDKKPGRLGLGIGKNCRIENCILDKNVLIGNNVTITNAPQVEDQDGENFCIREGIVIIPKGVRIPDGTTI